MEVKIVLILVSEGNEPEDIPGKFVHCYKEFKNKMYSIKNYLFVW